MQEYTQTTPKIITGEFKWKGNLDEYFQKVQKGVILPVVQLDGKRLNAKLFTEFCMVNKKDRHEQDHASIRLQSINEIFGSFTSDILAIRVFTKVTPGLNSQYVLHQLNKLLSDTWKGEHDSMIRQER